MKFKLLLALPTAFLLLLVCGTLKESFSQGPSGFEFAGQMSGHAADVDVEENLAYVVGLDKLKIIDISNPTNPYEKGSYVASGCFFSSLDVTVPYAYLTQQSIYCWRNGIRYLNSLHVVDVSVAENPLETGLLDIAGPAAVEVAESGMYAYVTSQHGGLLIIDVSDAANPQQVGIFQPAGAYFMDVKVVGSYAYLADSNGGLWIVDVFNPTNPTEINSYHLTVPTNVLGVTIEGNYAFLAAGSYGLRIIDISDPQNLNEVGFIHWRDIPDYDGYMTDVEISGNYAFVADGSEGVRAINISDPTDPEELDHFDTNGFASKVAISGNYIYVADSENGLVILKFSELSPSTPTPFLDLPWDYEGKGMVFRDAALAINSYFDHRYPLLKFSHSGPISSKQCSPPALYEEAPKTLKFDGVELPYPELSYNCHDGYDYGRSLARLSLGESVLASADGCAYYRKTTGGGNEIHIIHNGVGTGYQTRYLHLRDNPDDPKDDPITKNTNPANCLRIDRGQRIGTVGATGWADGVHIHFMVVQDKDKDGDFDDDYPWGVTDPFGWFGNGTDPWSNFIWNGYNGNTSHYLWIGDIFGFSGLFNKSELNEIKAERYTYTFPENSFEKDVYVEERGGPVAKISNNLISIGSISEIKVVDASGNVVINPLVPFTLAIRFGNFDLTSFNQDTISIYSSPDGVNWAKEDTNVDLNNKTATAQLGHLSHFALMAERLDTTAPATNAVLSGDEGQPSWFRSNVQVTLDATDNEGGLGVDYTLYKINDSDWLEYISPLEFTDEGTYSIEFYSADNDENIEDIKSVQFNIDKTHPEVKIEFNPATLETEIIGQDENQSIVSIENVNKVTQRIIIKDEAGNTLNITGNYKKLKTDTTLSIKSINYNGGSPISYDKNLFNTHYQASGGLKRLSQSWYNEGDILVSITYKSSTNQSTIVTKKLSEVKEVKTQSGLVILSLMTNNGNLEIEY